MKYIKLILSLSIIFTSNAFSETFLCVGDEGAEVTNIGQSIQSKLITAERLKLILSNESGEWSLKYHGGIPTGLDRCINGSLCERSDDSFGGLFLKDNLNVL